MQRRHQKLIEEAPSPAHDGRAAPRNGRRRRRLGAKSIGYLGAGTIEFLLDEDGSFYFMEMNTRIQVEHPVTEMVTGVDLVKEQIRIAAGEKHDRHRARPPLRGHAIECRDQRRGPGAELPAVTRAASTRSIRPAAPACASTRTCTRATPCRRYYDSLIAKVIVPGPRPRRGDRQDAPRAGHVRGAGDHDDDSVPGAGDGDPNFVKGQVHTKFLESRAPI